MARSLYKLPFIHKSFHKGFEIKDKVVDTKKSLTSLQRKLSSFSKKLYIKSSCISNAWVDRKVGIYNGKTFITLNVNYRQLGFKLGQFCITRKMAPHSGKQKQKKKVSRALERLVSYRKSVVNRRPRIK